jgi:hypothetical protein
MGQGNGISPDVCEHRRCEKNVIITNIKVFASYLKLIYVGYSCVVDGLRALYSQSYGITVSLSLLQFIHFLSKTKHNLSSIRQTTHNIHTRSQNIYDKNGKSLI